MASISCLGAPSWEPCNMRQKRLQQRQLSQHGAACHLAPVQPPSWSALPAAHRTCSCLRCPLVAGLQLHRSGASLAAIH